MGTLFPDDPEYPDHKPIASPVDAAKDAAPTVALIGMFVISGDGPDNLVKPNTRAVGRQAITWVSSATSQAHVPMPFNQFDWQVPQRRSSNAHMMMSSTNTTLLYGDTPSTNHESTGIFRADNA